MRFPHIAACLLALAPLHAQEVQTLELPPTPGLEQAHFLVHPGEPNPQGVLVLLSGHNVSPEKLLADPAWQELAKKHRLGLLGCYFKNNMSAQSGFYQFPANGAGKLLMDAVRKAYKRDLPLAIYGFSAGSQFTARFVALQPRRIKVWAAYAPGSVDTLRPGPSLPPGILLCGANDTERLDKARTYFEEGRSNGSRWLWATVPNTGHTAAPAAEALVRSFFDAVLTSGASANSGEWINLEDGKPAPSGGTRKPAFGWVPSAAVATEWQALTGVGAP